MLRVESKTTQFSSLCSSHRAIRARRRSLILLLREWNGVAELGAFSLCERTVCHGDLGVLVFSYLLCFVFVYIVLVLLICRVSFGNSPGVMILRFSIKVKLNPKVLKWIGTVYNSGLTFLLAQILNFFNVWFQ